MLLKSLDYRLSIKNSVTITNKGIPSRLQAVAALAFLMQNRYFSDGCHSTSQYLNVLFSLNTEGIQLEPSEMGKSGAVFMVGGLTFHWQSTDC